MAMRQIILITTLILTILTSRAQVERPDSVASDSISLGEVVVKANTETHTPGKDRVLITRQMREGAYDVGRLLGRVPGVTFNPANRSVSVLGSQNIKILVDSIERDQEVIKRMSPDKFAYVTIVHNPLGKYAGYDAVINIRTRPTYRGYEGMLNEGVGISPGDGLGKGEHLSSWNSMASASYTREKLTLSASGRHWLGHSASSSYYTQTYPLNNLRETVREQPFGDPVSRSRTTTVAADASADWQINDNHSVSALWQGFFTGNNSTNTSYTLGRETLDGTPLGDIRFTSRTGSRDGRNNILGLYYRGRFSKAWDMYTWATYNHDSDINGNSSSRSDIFAIDDDSRVKMDYLWGGTTVNFAPGGKWAFALDEQMHSIRYNSYDLATGVRESHSDEVRSRSMLSASFTPSERLSLQLNAGVSTQHITQDGTGHTAVKPLAEARLYWKPSERFLMRLNYRTTHFIPPLSYLQDFGQFTDSLTYTHGNPALKPLYGHDFTASFYLFNTLWLTARWHQAGSSVLSIASAATGLRPDGITGPYVAYRYENVPGHYFELNANLYKNISREWAIQMYGTLSQMEMSFGGQSNHRWYADLLAGAYYMPSGLDMIVNLNYNLSPSVTVSPQTLQYGYSDLLVLNFEKSLLKGRLNIGFAYTFPVHLADGLIKGHMVSPGLIRHTWQNNQRRSNNGFNIGVTYRFNGGAQVRKYQRDTDKVSR